MRFDLHYGHGLIGVEIPQRNVGAFIEPWHGDLGRDNVTALSDGISDEEIAKLGKAISDKRVCVLVADGTRDMPIADVLGRIKGVFGGAKSVRFMICTGTHNGDTQANRKIAEVLQGCVAGAEVFVHDCQQAEFVCAGQTSGGTVADYNSQLQGDVFLVLADVKQHYFAGYSNPVKYFLPGASSYQAAENNHSLTLSDGSTFGVHPWHNDKTRRNNPLAADQVEAMEMIVGDREVWTVATISCSGVIQWAGLGKAKEVSTQTFDLCDKMNSHVITPADRLIVSPGGMPNDVDLYISQRALELTKSAVNDGGQVLFVSACGEGVGSERTKANFYDRLIQPVDNIMQTVKDDYKLFSHKAYRFAEMIESLEAIWVYSEISDDVVESMHLRPCGDIQGLIDGWIAADEDVKINIVDGANKLALY